MEVLWSGLKSIISNNNSKVNIISKLNDLNGSVATDPAVIANTFNDFFVNEAGNVAKRVGQAENTKLSEMSEKIS